MLFFSSETFGPRLLLLWALGEPMTTQRSSSVNQPTSALPDRCQVALAQGKTYCMST